MWTASCALLSGPLLLIGSFSLAAYSQTTVSQAAVSMATISQNANSRDTGSQDLGSQTLAVAETPKRLAVDEEFHYRWRLTNVLGFLAGFFYPSQGDGVLSFQSNEAGNLVSQLEITSEKGEEGDFWFYGAEVDPDRGRTLRAWSSYRYGEKQKEKRSEVEEDGVVDVASGIYRIRQNPPTKVETMRIWSDGKVYGVQVIPKGEEIRRVGSKRVKTSSYSIRGLDEAGLRPWKGSLELWLAKDEKATPVAILIRRKGIGVLLDLQQDS